jgi:hypothetical protein
MKPLPLFRFLILAAAVLLMAGCEQLFTTNLLSGLERDPSRLSFEGQINYARQALKSGDPKIQAKAYDALAASLTKENNTDPELNSLAITLALGASGLTGLLGGFIDVATGDGFSDSTALAAALNDKLGDVNYTYIQAALAQITAMEANGGTPSESQYVFAIAGAALELGNAAGGMELVTDWSSVNALAGDALLAHPDSTILGELQSL